MSGVEIGLKYCEYCGSSIKNGRCSYNCTEPKYCRSCGAELLNGGWQCPNSCPVVMYCGDCGSRLTESTMFGIAKMACPKCDEDILRDF